MTSVTCDARDAASFTRLIITSKHSSSQLDWELPRHTQAQLDASEKLSRQIRRRVPWSVSELECSAIADGIIHFLVNIVAGENHPSRIQYHRRFLKDRARLRINPCLIQRPFESKLNLVGTELSDESTVTH